MTAPAREPGRGPTGLLARAGRLLAFAGWYVRRFLAANVVVLREVLTPGTGVAPVVHELVLRCRTDVEVASYIALVGLTPGTLVVSSHDGRPRGDGQRRRSGPRGTGRAAPQDRSGEVVVAAHVMHAEDAAAALVELRELETRLLRALRADPAAVPPPPRGSGARRHDHEEEV